MCRSRHPRPLPRWPTCPGHVRPRRDPVLLGPANGPSLGRPRRLLRARLPPWPGDPLYGIQKLLRAGAEKLTDNQWTRFENAIAARPEEHLAVYVASCAQQLRSAYRHPNTAESREIAEKVLATFASCPIPEIARPGRTLKRWRQAFLAYFDTARWNNGGTEAMNGLIELHRVARGFRNRESCCLRMLLIGGGLTSPHLR